MMKRTFLLAAMLAATLVTRTAVSQEARATIGGKVFDGQGAVIPNAQVVVTSDDTGVKQTATTNPDGNWSVRFLITGHYRFTVAYTGLKHAERVGI